MMNNNIKKNKKKNECYEYLFKKESQEHPSLPKKVVAIIASDHVKMKEYKKECKRK